MTRSRIAPTLGPARAGLAPTRTGLGRARLALSLVVLGLAACSFSFKAGSDASPEAGKPAIGGDEPTKPTSKPVGKTDPDAPTEPNAPAEPTEDAGPTRTPPVEEPPPVVEPKLTAVCRVTDPLLEAVCHRALDPIAADDIDAWSAQLGEGVVVTRPGFGQGTQRFRGPQAVRDAAAKAGGVRSMLHLRPTDRVVGTVSNDCRQCRRSFVAFEANTRSGTIAVTVEMTQPPRIMVVEVGSQIRRRHLGELRKPTEQPPAEQPPTEQPPAEQPPAEQSR